MTDMPNIITELSHFCIDTTNDTPPTRRSVEFYKVLPETIHRAEKVMERRFPPQLRLTYEAIGSGFVQSDRHGRTNLTSMNSIPHPEAAAEMYSESKKSPNDFDDFLTAGEMPVFELGARHVFVCRPDGDNPEAIYESEGSDDLVAPDFFTLLERLREDVTFYRFLWKDVKSRWKD